MGKCQRQLTERIVRLRRVELAPVDALPNIGIGRRQPAPCEGKDFSGTQVQIIMARFSPTLTRSRFLLYKFRLRDVQETRDLRFNWNLVPGEPVN